MERFWRISHCVLSVLGADVNLSFELEFAINPTV
jgi:hypothetical protein